MDVYATVAAGELASEPSGTGSLGATVVGVLPPDVLGVAVEETGVAVEASARGGTTVAGWRGAR